MCQIACNKEMPSSHFYITLAAHGWLTSKHVGKIGPYAYHLDQPLELPYFLHYPITIPGHLQ